MMPVQVINDPTQISGYKTGAYLNILGGLLSQLRAKDDADRAAQLQNFEASSNAAGLGNYERYQAADPALQARLYPSGAPPMTPKDQLQQATVNERQRLLDADPNTLGLGEFRARESMFNRANDRMSDLSHLAAMDQALANAGVADTDNRRKWIGIQLRTLTDAGTDAKLAQMKAQMEQQASQFNAKQSSAQDKTLLTILAALAKNGDAGAQVKLADKVGIEAPKVNPDTVNFYIQQADRVGIDRVQKFLKDDQGMWHAVKAEYEKRQIPLGGEMLPAAAKSYADTLPYLQQVDALLRAFEPFKNINDIGFLTAERAKYALGLGSDYGSLGEKISALELNKISGAARILKGSSRAYQALERGMIHLPNPWKDSPQKSYQQLLNVRQNLAEILQDLKTFGVKGLTTRALPDVVPYKPGADNSNSIGMPATADDEATQFMKSKGLIP